MKNSTPRVHYRRPVAISRSQGLRSYDPPQIPRIPQEGSGGKSTHRAFHNEAIYRAIRLRLGEIDEMDERDSLEEECSCEELLQQVETLQQQVEGLRQLISKLSAAVAQLTATLKATNEEVDHVAQTTAYHYSHLHNSMQSSVTQVHAQMRSINDRINLTLASPTRSAHRFSFAVPSSRPSWQRYSSSAQLAFVAVRILGLAAFVCITAYVAVGLMGLGQITLLMEQVVLPVFQILGVTALITFVIAGLVESL